MLKPTSFCVTPLNVYFGTVGVMAEEDKIVQCGDAKTYFENCFKTLPESSQAILQNEQFHIPYTDEEIEEYCM